MQLTFAGAGSAFTVGGDNYHSNLLLEIEGDRLLIDCGSDARFSLYELGYQSSDIDSVYISHLHADHVGGLEWFGFSRYFNPNAKRPNLYLHEEVEELLWPKILAVGMGSLEQQEATLETYFSVNRLQTEFVWHGIRFELVKMFHVRNCDQWTPCYGLFFKYAKDTILFTADTRFTPEHLLPYYESATVIFHECETSAVPSAVHAHYNDLKTLDPSIKAKMWLYHYQPGELPIAEDDGFLGFVKKGQCFNY